jgi:hypothetical protein
LLDLNKDLINVAPVDNFDIDVADIWITDLTSIKPVSLPPGRNVIAVSGIDIYANTELCTYVVEIVSVVACCGAPNVGRIISTKLFSPIVQMLYSS